MESNDQTTGQDIQQNAASHISIAAAVVLASTTGWATAGVILAEFDGASSNIFQNNFTTAIKSGNTGSGLSSGQGSLTLGSADIAWNPAGLNFWNGTIVELIAFQGTTAAPYLSTTQIGLLRRYLNNRYGLSIG